MRENESAPRFRYESEVRRRGIAERVVKRRSRFQIGLRGETFDDVAERRSRFGIGRNETAPPFRYGYGRFLTFSHPVMGSLPPPSP